MDISQSLIRKTDKKRKLDDYIHIPAPEININYDELPACLMEDVPQTPKEINYGSYFFRKDLIDKFEFDVKSISTNSLLNKYKLYNGDDLINFISQCPGSYTRGIETTDRFSSYRNIFLNKIKQELALLCSDISESYGEQAMRRALGGDIMNYDIVVLADPNIMEDTRLPAVMVDDPTQGEKWLKKARTRRMMTFEEFSKYKLDSIIGFVIVEKGMCKRYANAYGINLICSRSGVEPGIGSLLMGLYLYTIVSHPKELSSSTLINYPSGKATIRYELIEIPDEISYQKPVFSTPDQLVPLQHIGILELAGSYLNVPGLCLYEKFGFKYEPLLLKEDCFSDIENLPMILSFSSNPKYKPYWRSNIEQIKQTLIKISIGYKNLDGTTYDVPLSSRSKVCGLRDRNAQKLYGYLKNLYIFEINRRQSISEDPDEDYYSLYMKLKQIEIENKIFITDLITGLTNGILLNKQNVSLDTRTGEKISINLSELYPLINITSGGKKIKQKNKKSKRRISKKIKSHHKRNKNKKTYKKKLY